jgi:uncharacterized membrane protein YraQ (UPF0718 family)
MLLAVVYLQLKSNGHVYSLPAHTCCPIYTFFSIVYNITQPFFTEGVLSLRTIVYNSTLYFIFICALVFIFLLLTNQTLPDFSWVNGSNIQNFKTMFLSIILEALPFILLGVLISSLLQTFVSEQTITRIIPKNPFLAILFACLIGIIFPVCECGMIPIVRRLIKKGMPVYVAVVFILTGPILNPIVYAATFMAFRSRPEIAYSRMALAFVVACIIGLVIYRFVKSNPLREVAAITHEHDHNHNHSHEHSNEHEHKHNNKLFGMLGHASDEFFEMGKYLMFGSLITAIIQTLVARESLVSVGQDGLGSHLFMMGFAYILSLCSTSDAFVASSFINTFTTGSLLTFLVFGPMLDFKGTLMLLSVFKTKFVLILTALIVVTVLAGSLIFERLFF